MAALEDDGGTQIMKILTHRSCIVSAKLLRGALSAILGRPILVTRDPARIRGPFIRYGSGEPVAGCDTEFNSAAFVKLVSDKSAFARLMKEKDVYSPVYYQQTLPTPAQYPVIIRKTLNSSGGRGIVVCPDAAAFTANWNAAYVWTPFVKTQFELRVHVLGGKIVKILKKRYVGLEAAAHDEDDIENDEPELAEPALPIRNLQRGYHYSARNLDRYPAMFDVVKAIHPILGGQFYTLDVGWDKKVKRYFVFEANSGSGLNAKTVALYADYLAREIMA